MKLNKGDTVLVTGGAGYVGTRFCNEYINNYDITVIDNFWFGDLLDERITKIKKDIKDRFNPQRLLFGTKMKV